MIKKLRILAEYAEAFMDEFPMICAVGIMLFAVVFVLFILFLAADTGQV